MDVDRAQLDLGILAPHLVEQLLAREDAARVLQEVAQQAEFGRAEMDRLAASSALAGWARRMTARSRAISSAGLNGLTI